MGETPSPPASPLWKRTALWSQLQAKQTPLATDLAQLLPPVLARVSTILSDAGTGPLDFTLHDAAHAYRVTELIAKVIPSDVLPLLSEIETAFLLLAAFLHDIGMSPSADKVRANRAFLLTGDRTSLSESDYSQLQTWLDLEHPDFRVPPAGSPHGHHVALVDRLTMEYCRSRHADWADQWIADNLQEDALPLYRGWRADIALLCRSHSEPVHAIRSSTFDAKLTGSPPCIVNLRYLACALRLADVLDLHPERTPDVLIRHRAVSPESLIYWLKDRYITLNVSSSEVAIYARPTSALLHKAVEETANAIAFEMGGCRLIADDMHLNILPGRHDPTPHRWDMTSSPFVDVSPDRGQYEYIDGAFRPDTERLLQLLSGVQLYGNPMAAVRELIQNAFDAVREKIAYRLLESGGLSPAQLTRLADNEAVSLHLDRHDDGYWLECRDSGMGMTKSIIKDHLLVTGKARRPDILLLDRRCQEAGIVLGRTGQFGIGVLSYFMIADKVIFLTRREIDAHDYEPNGWQFETTGIGSFGELRKSDQPAHGTRVRLHLAQSATQEPSDSWFRELIDYVSETIRYSPCRFTVTSSLAHAPSLDLPAGWTTTNHQLVTQLLGSLDGRIHLSPFEDEVPLDILSAAKKVERQAQDLYWQSCRENASQSIRFDTEEGPLPGEIGRYRLHLPYFALEGGDSLAFMLVERPADRLVISPLGKGLAFTPPASTSLSCAGFAVDFPYRHHFMPGRRRSGLQVAPLSELAKHGIVEIELLDPKTGQISVDRSELALTELGTQALTFVSRRLELCLSNLLSRLSVSPYTLLSHAIVGAKAGPAPALWIAEHRPSDLDDPTTFTWEDITFPAIDSLAFVFSEPFDVTCEGKPVTILRCVTPHTEGKHYDGPAWHTAATPPDRIVRLLTYRQALVPMWLQAPNPQHAHSPLTAEFPPSWHDLIGARFSTYSSVHSAALVLNPSNPIAALITRDSLNWARRTFGPLPDPLPFTRDILSDPAKAATWLVHCMQNDNSDLWDGLPGRDPEFLEGLWRIIFSSSAAAESEPYDEALIWIEETPNARLRCLTPTSWRALREDKDIGLRLHDPGEEWTLSHLPRPRRLRQQ